MFGRTKTTAPAATRLSEAAKPLATPLPYPWRTRLVDAWHGRRDAARGLPPLDPTDSGADGAGRPPVHTPTTYVLSKELRDACSAELLQFEADTAAQRIELRALSMRIETATKALPDRPGTVGHDGGPALRKAGEERLDEAVVALRRGRERAAARGAAAAEHRKLVESLAADREQRERLAETIAAEHRQTVHRCTRLREHQLRRFGVYQRSLLRRHPARGRLLGLLDQLVPQLPEAAERELTVAELLAVTDHRPADRHGTAPVGTEPDAA